jgi:hypothetical protein
MNRVWEFHASETLSPRNGMIALTNRIWLRVDGPGEASALVAL